MESFLVVVFIYGLHLILLNVLLFSSPHIDIIAKILLGCEIFIFSPPVLRIISIKFEVDKSFFLIIFGLYDKNVLILESFSLM